MSFNHEPDPTYRHFRSSTAIPAAPSSGPSSTRPPAPARSYAGGTYCRSWDAYGIASVGVLCDTGFECSATQAPFLPPARPLRSVR